MELLEEHYLIEIDEEEDPSLFYSIIADFFFDNVVFFLEAFLDLLNCELY